MRPINALRWCFILLSAVIVTELLITLIGSCVCYYLFITGKADLGSCSGFTGQAREIWAEALAAILALLLGAKYEPPKL
jgi:hypothetical protein